MTNKKFAVKSFFYNTIKNIYFFGFLVSFLFSILTGILIQIWIYNKNLYEINSFIFRNSSFFLKFNDEHFNFLGRNDIDKICVLTPFNYL